MKHFAGYILIAVMILSGCSASSSKTSTSVQEDITIPAEYENESYNSSTATSITFQNHTADINGTGASVKETAVVISQAGTYVINGTWNGSIEVNVSSKNSVHLIFNGIQITSSDGPALLIKKGNTVITLSSDSENVLSDSSEYTDEDLTAVLYARDDLAINGNGSLTVNGNYNDGITSRDSLYILNGNIDVSAKDDGIVGRDLLYIKDGTVSVNAEGDGVKTTNESSEKGSLEIAGGTLNITVSDDGIESIQNAWIKNGTITIHASSVSDKKAKGISIGSSLVIEGGNINIESSDDAVNASENIEIDGGTITISAGDDGIHADNSLTVNKGSIDIQKSAEGLEAKILTINDGDISIISSDDGINTSDPAVKESMQADDSMLTINGGNITIDADGDGIDMNGSGTMNDGTVIIYGPAQNMDGALDFSGTFTVNGGTLTAGGSNGMPQFPDTDSKAYTIVIGTGGGTLSIQDDTGNEIMNYTSSKSYTLLSYTSDSLKKGSTYTIYENATVIGSVTISDTISYVNYTFHQNRPGLSNNAI